MKKEYLRDVVLEVLDLSNPEPIDALVLYGVLDRLGYQVTPRKLDGALNSLQSRGMATFQLSPRHLPRGLNYSAIQITARGAETAK